MRIVLKSICQIKIQSLNSSLFPFLCSGARRPRLREEGPPGAGLCHAGGLVPLPGAHARRPGGAGGGLALGIPRHQAGRAQEAARPGRAQAARSVIFKYISPHSFFSLFKLELKIVISNPRLALKFVTTNLRKIMTQ